MGGAAFNDTFAGRAAARFVAFAVTAFARLVTAAQPDWRDVDPTSTAQRIYYANHVSHGDFVLVWSVLPQRLRERTRPVAGADYWTGSALRRFVGTAVFRSVLIERTPRAGGADPIGQMAEALDAGASLLLFPEGTRNLGDEPLLPFKTGLARLAIARPEVDVVPVWIDNLNRVLPKGTMVPVPLMCRVTFGAPVRIDAGESVPAFLARARDALLALRPRPEAP